VASVPIACSLDSDGAAARGEEWRRFIDHAVLEVLRVPAGARLRLKDEAGVVVGAVDLARKEGACCPFFEFRLALAPDAVWLEIDVPTEASFVLDALLT
jgi:hypothetical protein